MDTENLRSQSIQPPPKPKFALPQPFAWIDIPAAHVKLPTNEDENPDFVNLGAYSISKYPITNAQFAKFIEADGYKKENWWTEQGWEQRNEEKWTEPRYWGDSKWNGNDQPVVDVSWFEAVAFCLWMSEVTGENIMLPTEDQWQYAAQGDDGLEYPWGNNWDCKRCNNSVDPCNSKVTTPVTQYEDKGDSPFGVVDMVGNVWEWCLTDYRKKINGVNISTNMIVLRGGSWDGFDAQNFRASFRDWYDPSNWYAYFGFRISRS